VSLAFETASDTPSGGLLVPHSFTDPAFQAAVRVIQRVNASDSSSDTAIAGILHALAAQDVAFIL